MKLNILILSIFSLFCAKTSAVTLNEAKALAQAQK